MIKIFSLFISLCVLCACSQKVVLQTDSDESIDLSGRWNQTDAEITESALFNQLVSSAWIKNYERENSFKPKILVNDFQTNFDEVEVGQYLQQLFEKSIEGNQLLDLITAEDRASYEHFILSGTLQAEDISEFEEKKAINYSFSVQLKDRSGTILWEGREEIKKYIKD